jgi:hydroxyacylglutathione hydrolase
MALTVHQFACLDDNYGYLIRDDASGKTACIDTPDAQAVLDELKKLGWKLDLILNTHWHPDHAGGNEVVQKATGAKIFGPVEVRRIAPVDTEVADGDTVDLGETRFDVLDTGGHTLGHVSYVGAGSAFVGDTLFSMGCGRMFEGDPDQFWTSLSKLASLPDETVVYCAHEYTASNARFALSVDASAAVAERAKAVFAARERGDWTVPSTIAEEKATNPFLRAPQLVSALGLDTKTDAEAFAAIRSAKDNFKG